MGMKQSAYTLKLVVILAVGILVLATGLFSWHRQNIRLTQISKQLNSNTLEMDNIHKETDQRKAYLDEDSSLDKALANLNLSLKAYQYTPSYLEQLQQIATRTGNIITRIQPGELRPIDLKSGPLSTEAQTGTEPGSTAKKFVKKPVGPPTTTEPTAKQYQVQQIDLEVCGSYMNLLRLLDSLRTFPKLVYVRTLAITPRNALDEARGSMTIRLETYVVITPEQYKPDEEPPADKGANNSGAAPATGGAH